MKEGNFIMMKGSMTQCLNYCLNYTKYVWPNNVASKYKAKFDRLKAHLEKPT